VDLSLGKEGAQGFVFAFGGGNGGNWGPGVRVPVLLPEPFASLTVVFSVGTPTMSAAVRIPNSASI